MPNHSRSLNDSTHQKRKEDLVYTRRHFKTHFKKWENSDNEHLDENSNAMFNELHADQDGGEDSTESEVAVRSPNG